ncbi:hypothetical protein M3204_14005 [Mesobacillus subterraneus]|uniref:hypothetical protein n=1 Tax=Mesobacillus subterraneus TaxID=285983 RepID=UPI00203ECCDE|nr:hypothetical protein [Mesobacillus subterraneus]MCM3665527.1 hypothetical protein [Mesobacillus subterraneus]MCM3686086.1 hypothetical protein [Mesobacillus subterraneus]
MKKIRCYLGFHNTFKHMTIKHLKAVIEVCHDCRKLFIKGEKTMKTNCVFCDSQIDMEKDKYSVGESMGEYWCEECLSTGSDER